MFRVIVYTDPPFSPQKYYADGVETCDGFLYISIDKDNFVYIPTHQITMVEVARVNEEGEG